MLFVEIAHVLHRGHGNVRMARFCGQETQWLQWIPKCLAVIRERANSMGHPRSRYLAIAPDAPGHHERRALICGKIGCPPFPVQCPRARWQLWRGMAGSTVMGGPPSIPKSTPTRSNSTRPPSWCPDWEKRVDKWMVSGLGGICCPLMSCRERRLSSK